MRIQILELITNLSFFIYHREKILWVTKREARPIYACPKAERCGQI